MACCKCRNGAAPRGRDWCRLCSGAVNVAEAAQYRFHSLGHRELAETLVARAAEQVRDLIRLDQQCEAQRSNLMRRLQDTRQKLDEITNTVEKSARPKSLPRSLARALGAAAASASATTAAAVRADAVAETADKERSKSARHENEESEEETADEATVPTTGAGGDAPGGAAGHGQSPSPPHAAAGTGAAREEHGPYPAGLLPPVPPQPTRDPSVEGGAGVVEGQNKERGSGKGRQRQVRHRDNIGAALHAVLGSANVRCDARGCCHRASLSGRPRTFAHRASLSG
eukprot:s3057_g13.t1